MVEVAAIKSLAEMVEVEVAVAVTKNEGEVVMGVEIFQPAILLARLCKKITDHLIFNHLRTKDVRD